MGENPELQKLSLRKRKQSESMIEKGTCSPLKQMDMSITHRTRIVKDSTNEEQYIFRMVNGSLNSEQGDIQTVRAKVSYCLTDRNYNKLKGPGLPKQVGQSRFGKEAEKSEKEEEPVEDSVDEYEGLCFICFANPSNCVFLDCGHGGVCLDCAMDTIKKNNICSLCRETVVQIIEIDTSREIRNGVYKVLNSYFVSREEPDLSGKEYANLPVPPSSEEAQG